MRKRDRSAWFLFNFCLSFLGVSVIMPSQATSDIEVIVTVDDRHLSRLQEIAEQLKAIGIKDVQTQIGIGLITGKGSSDALNAARKVPGITAVEPTGSVQIAPPESDIQ
jgi:hypothetical protein